MPTTAERTVEPVTNPNPGPRRSTRRLLAVPLAALFVGTLGLVPGPAPARAAVPTGAAAPNVDAGVDLLASGGKPAKPQGETPDPADPEAPAGDLAPSIHYRDDQEHATDVLAFEPGGLVTVPFSPRAGDHWQIDGRAPRKLPAGHATGRQMHDARQGSVWSDAAPADLAASGNGVAPASAAGGAPDTAVDGAELTSAAITPTDETIAAAPIGPDGLRREIFGFLPYWELSDSSTVLDWRTLSTVAYFSVGCTSGGSLMKRNADGSTTTGWAGWTSSKMTSIINAAHAHRTRVVLTVSCFAWSSTGATTQARLLGSASARSNLARQIAAAVRDRGADGVNLDFEPIVTGYANEFTALVRKVRSELNAVAPGYQLTFDTMGSIGNQPIADATAPGGADAVFVMGYDYRTGSSSQAGSISPLTGPLYDLTDTVKAYTARISPSKVILGVPYYGRAWSTASSVLNARNISGAKYGGSASPTYAQAADIVAAYGRRWDSVEQAPWTAYRKQTCTSTYGCVTSWRELYYDDAASLRRRYDLVNRAALRGTGIWALGYDNARPELRTALADKFIADRTPPVTGVVTLAQQQRDEGFRVAWTSYDDSTVKGYDVQVSVDGGAWAAWLTGTTQTSSIYLGTNGRTYAFRVRATDVHGNVSAWAGGSAPGALSASGSIAVGGFASVATDGLRMRASASTGASIMTTLSAGDALQVIGGPTSAEGYTWYQVAGPVRQWPPVDPMQRGGWVAASGNGVTNAVPRRPVYATRLDAGLTGLRLNGGGERVLTPNGDGKQDKLHLTWTNHGAFDSLSLRVHRADGTLAGSVALGGTGSGSHAFDWDGRLGGARVPAGTYVIQVQGKRGGTTFSAPSVSPVSATHIARFGVIVAQAAPTSVLIFKSPFSPNRARTLTWGLTFGGPIGGLSTGDFARGGTATGCVVGTPTGAGASWAVTLTGCSAGTVTLGLKPRTVVDAVRNWGPATQMNAPSLRIDRSAPVSAKPKLTLRTGVNLASTSTTTGLLANLTWSATDPGGAGIRSYDLKRSTDGGAFTDVATSVASTSLAVSLAPGHSYRFAVRARDRAGNVGAWVTGPAVGAWLPQQTSTVLTWKGGWTKIVDERFSGSSVRYATAVGASARYVFTGRSIAWVSTLAPSMGAARVYLDGSFVATIDLHAATKSFGRVVFARTWAAVGTHTLRIVVVGTAGHPRVDLDALEILR